MNKPDGKLVNLTTINKSYVLRIYYLVDVLWGQPIKLIQVASNSELRENQRNKTPFFFLKLFPVIASGPQKYKHKIGHNYFTF